MWWHKVNRTLDFSSQLFIRLFLQQQLQILSYINYSIDFSSEPLSFLLFFSLLKKQKQALRYHLVSRLFSSDIKVRHTGFWCSMSLDSMVRTAQQVVDVPWTCKDVPFCHKAKVFRFAADTALFRSENYNIHIFFWEPRQRDNLNMEICHRLVTKELLEQYGEELQIFLLIFPCWNVNMCRSIYVVITTWENWKGAS